MAHFDKKNVIYSFVTSKNKDTSATRFNFVSAEMPAALIKQKYLQAIFQN